MLIGLPAGRAAEGRLEALAAELGTDRALPFAADITVTGSNEAMANAAVERFGSLDVLVCNAGISLLKPFEAITINEWREVMTADLDTCFLGAQAALPFLKGSRGNIVNVASASGLGGDRQLTAYNAAKGAVVN